MLTQPSAILTKGPIDMNVAGKQSTSVSFTIIKVGLIAGGGLELENVWISEGEQMGLGFNF